MSVTQEVSTPYRGTDRGTNSRKEYWQSRFLAGTADGDGKRTVSITARGWFEPIRTVQQTESDRLSPFPFGIYRNMPPLRLAGHFSEAAR